MRSAKIMSAVAAMVLFVSNPAFAGEEDHDARPRHGGVVSVVKDVNYELVAKPDTMTLYITDHHKPVNTKEASGTLTLLNASEKTEAKLVPAGENMLQAKGNFKVDKGTKAVALVTTGGKLQSVRFTLK